MSQLTPIASSVIIPDVSHPPVEISLVPYTSEWARDFEREKKRLVDAFAGDPLCQEPDWKDKFAEYITHVGSTSIPGALAKPYIDIYARKDKMCTREFFEKHGYRVYGSETQYFNSSDRCYCLSSNIDRFVYLYKPCQGESSTCKGFFLHLCTSDDMLKFAKRLQSDASLVEMYNEAKRRIVADHPRISFPEYAMLKTAFILNVTEDVVSNHNPCNARL